MDFIGSIAVPVSSLRSISYLRRDVLYCYNFIWKSWNFQGYPKSSHKINIALVLALIIAQVLTSHVESFEELTLIVD